jgi:hypothetical protein
MSLPSARRNTAHQRYTTAFSTSDTLSPLPISSHHSSKIIASQSGCDVRSERDFLNQVILRLLSALTSFTAHHDTKRPPLGNTEASCVRLWVRACDCVCGRVRVCVVYRHVCKKSGQLVTRPQLPAAADRMHPAPPRKLHRRICSDTPS